MPFYNDLRPATDFEDRDFEQVFPGMTKAEKLRTLNGLKELRSMLRQKVSARRTEGNLVIASWNILELGYGTRHGESMYYIAEILSVFDLIAVQELTPKRADLDRLMRILGPNWSYIYTDPARGAGSDDESSAYIFNTDRVRPTGLSGELTVWTDEMEASLGPDIDAETKTLTRFAAQRPPHVVGFTTRWKSFSMINLHLEPGNTRKAHDIRMKEVALVMAALQENDDLDWAKRTILVGDMNLYRNRDEPLIDFLHALGFWESGGLVGRATNVPHRDQNGNLREGHVFDRMFFSVRDYFRIALETLEDGSTRERGGVVPVFDAVLREDDWQTYRQYLIDKKKSAADKEEMRTDDAAARKYFSDSWRDRQISDHLPIWVELETDDTDAFLDSNIEEITAEPG